MSRRWRFPAFLSSLCLLPSAAGAQSPETPSEAPRLICGRVVRDEDLAPVEAAMVGPKGFGIEGLPVETDAAGAFEIAGEPRCLQSTATSNRGLDYLLVNASGCGVALVDPCAKAPWADPIRLRPGATLAGRVEGLGEGRWVTVIAPATELCWPPRSGLTCVDQRSSAQTDADGRFLIADVTAQVPLSVRLDAGSTASGIKLTAEDLVLRPGEQREITLTVPPSPAVAPGDERAEPSGHWVSVYPLAFEERDPSGLTWFEFVKGGRLVRHRVGGGRWHVHQHRACNDLEIQPGRATLVGRDADGRIGVEVIGIRDSESAIRPRMQLAPGGLLRLDGSRLEGKASIMLSSSDVEFASFELLPGAVRYEIVPVGSVRMMAGVEGREPQPRGVEVTAGSVVEIVL